MKDEQLKREILEAVDNVQEYGFMNDNPESDFLNEADFNKFLTVSMPEYWNMDKNKYPFFRFIIPVSMWTFKF